MTRVIVPLVVAAVAVAGPVHAAPSIDLKIPNDLAMVSRPKSVGTNVRIVKVAYRELPPGTIARLLTPPLIERLEKCAGGMIQRISVEEGAMRDTIGDSTSRLKGVGLYLSMPDIQVTTMGTWFVAPFAALRLVAHDAAGKALAEAESSGFDKHVVPNDAALDTYLADRAGEIDRLLQETVDRVVREALPKVMPESLCGHGG